MLETADTGKYERWETTDNTEKKKQTDDIENHER